MKILWKNVWYNLVIRQFDLLKYYWKGQHKDGYYPLANWSCWYYPYLLSWTKKQENALNVRLDAAIKKLNFQMPLATKMEFAYFVYHDPLIRFPEQRSPQPPCSPGCYNHRTHPCEQCGRIGGLLPDTSQQPDTPRNRHEDNTNSKPAYDA